MKTFKQYLKEDIRIGGTYHHYLEPRNNNSKELKPKKGYVKSYLITNRTNAPIFRGTLNIMQDGRAIMHVNYVSYSGVKNNYKNYYNKDGREIIDSNNSDTKEKRYFDNL